MWILENTDLEIAARVAYWAEVVAPIVNEPVGATNIDLTRDYNDESIMGDIVTDSMFAIDKATGAFCDRSVIG